MAKDISKEMAVGAMAIAELKKRLSLRNIDLITVEGTEADPKHGIDYFVCRDGEEIGAGSHRHVRAEFEGRALLRYKRASGARTDWDKLINKPGNFMYTFSFGAIYEKMTFYKTTAASLRAWKAHHQNSLQNYIISPYGDGNEFLAIPFGELDYFGEVE